MTDPNKLVANIWKLYAIQACRWFLLLMPTVVLFFRENGLSLEQVFIVHAWYSACVILFEVPSGYFADRLGRRLSLLYGSVFVSAGFGAYAISYSFYEFLAAEFLIAVGAGFISGSDSALLYDSLIQLNRKEEYQKIAGRLSSMSNFSEGVAGILGGFLAVISLRTPVIWQAWVMVLMIPLVWSLVEPERKLPAKGESSFRAILKIVHYSLHGHKEVKWLILYTSLVGTSTLTIVWFVQPFLELVNVPLSLFGISWAVLQFAVGIFAILAHRIESFLGRRTALVSLILISSAGYFLLSQFQMIWAGLFFFLFYLVRGINGPVLNDYINRCVDSDIRATVLSVKSLVGRMMFMVLGPLAGWVADVYSLSEAFLLCGVIFLVFGSVFLFFLGRHQVFSR
jgi:MFS family permease